MSWNYLVVLPAWIMTLAACSEVIPAEGMDEDLEVSTAEGNAPEAPLVDGAKRQTALMTLPFQARVATVDFAGQ